MNIVITGSSGLVGSSCVREALSIDNVNVYSVSRQHQSYPQSSNFFHFNSLLELPTSVSYDLLIHAAAATPNNSNFDDIPFLNNIIDTNLCAFLQSNSVKHLIYLSTMAIYGQITHSAITENTSPNSPNIYGLSKFSGENQVAQTVQSLPTTLSILRLPGVVGRGMPMVFFRRCYDWLLNNQPITIQSLTAPFNNAIYVADIFHTAIKLLSHSSDTPLYLNLHALDQLTLNDFLLTYAQKLHVTPNVLVEPDAGRPFLITNSSNDNLLVTRSISSIIDSYLIS